MKVEEGMYLLWLYLQLRCFVLIASSLRYRLAKMPDIPVGSQVFDLAFHPHHDIVFTGLLTGGIKAHSYDEQGSFSEVFDLRPSKRSCRGLAMNADGSHLWAVGMAKALQTIDTTTGQLLEARKDIHK